MNGVEIRAAISPPYSRLEFVTPTFEATSRAVYSYYVIDLTEDDCRALSVCLKCGLSVALHPPDRLYRHKRRYCRAARRAAKDRR